MNTTMINVGGMGVQMIDDGDAIVRMTNNGKAWEPQTRLCWRELVTVGEGMLDVGAYTGVYAIASALIGAKVTAMEPHPVNFKRMHDNAALNSARLCMVIRAASARRGPCMLYTKRNNRISDTASLEYSGDASACAVMSVRIDDIKFETHLALIKIDVEHHEHRALLGAQRTIHEHKPIILVELLTAEARGRTVAMLGSLGYGHTVLDRRNYLFTLAARGGTIQATQRGAP